MRCGITQQPVALILGRFIDSFKFFNRFSLQSKGRKVAKEETAYYGKTSMVGSGQRQQPVSRRVTVKMVREVKKD